MILYPAIDIRGGHAVRLLQGDYERETPYDANPVDAALRWEREGAHFLHVVDLDGAKAGRPVNLEVIKAIADAVDCPIQAGGGLRDQDSFGAVIRAGAERAVIGTAALQAPAFLEELIEFHAERLVVSVDGREGKVSLAGWTETSDVEIADAVAELGQRGVERFLCTAIEVDGTMEGPAIDQLTEIASTTNSQVIASGGVGTLDHLRSLAGRCPANVEGAIVGRALYERKFTVAEAIQALNA